MADKRARKPELAAETTPTKPIDQLRRLIERAEADCKTWCRLTYRRHKIAVALVLWPAHNYLLDEGVETPPKAAKVIGKDWLAAVNAIKHQRLVHDIYERADRLDAGIVFSFQDLAAEAARSDTDWLPEKCSCQRCVKPLGSNHSCATCLSAAGWWKAMQQDRNDCWRAILVVRSKRAAFDALIERHKLLRGEPREIARRIRSIFENVKGCDFPFPDIVQAARQKLPARQEKLAHDLVNTLEKLQSMREIDPSFCGPDIDQLCGLLETVASKQREEAARSKRLVEWLKIELRGGKNNASAYALNALADIFEQATGERAHGNYSMREGDRETPFVRFVHDAFHAGGHEDWAIGLGAAADRLARSRKACTQRHTRKTT